MSRLLPFALAGLWIALLGSLRAADAGTTAETLAQKIRAEIGADWNVTYHKGTGLLEIESLQPVRMRTGFPSGGPAASRDSAAAKFSFTFRTVPLVSPPEYAERIKRNATLQHRIAELDEALRQRGIPYDEKVGEFRPRTEADKKSVAEYRRLQSTFEELPDFFFEDISLLWIEGSETAALDVAEPAAQRDCNVAIRKTLALLSRYVGGPAGPRPAAR